MKKSKKAIFITYLLCCFVPSSSNAEIPSDGDTTGVLQSWTKADNELNDTYSNLIKVINKKDKIKLIKAQRLWLKMIEIDCQWTDSENYYYCQIERFNSRAEQLRETNFVDQHGQKRKLNQ